MSQARLAPYDRIYRRLLELVPDLLSLRAGDYVRLAARGFMDLHVDVLGVDSKWTRLSLAHNWTLNGDTMADPDMEVRVSRDSSWPVAEALTFQQDAPPVYTVVYPTPQTVDAAAKRDLNAFLARTWLPNLKQQGHKVVETRRGTDDAAPSDSAGRAHQEEPESGVDPETSTWFDDDHGDPPPNDAAERLRWNTREILRHAIEHDVYVGDIAEDLKAGRLGEVAAWNALAAKLNRAGRDTYLSDTRFHAWAEGVRVACPACSRGACKGT